MERSSFNYDRHGKGYARFRRADPRIAAFVHEALGAAKTVLNVGAGAGSYEPEDRYVLALEPSAVMRAQRSGLRAPAVIGSAGSIPLDDNAVDASMAILSVHHWPDMAAGLNEMRRVSRDRVIIVTFDPDLLNDFWNTEYFPEVVEAEKRRYPTIHFLTDALGGRCDVQSIPVPLDCADGFQEAFYGRPEAFLDPEVRKAQSAWGFIPQGMEPVIVKRLADDLASGDWDRKFGHLREQPSFTCAFKLVVGYQ